MPFYNSSVSEKFLPDGVTPHDGQTAQVIYGSKKRDKYPVLLNCSLSVFTTATQFTTYRPLMTTSEARIVYYWLHVLGGAVVTAPLTVSRGGSTGNNVSDASYDPATGKYGAAYTGNGVYIPPGFNPGSASVEPWRDPLRHMPQKDVWYLRHWIARRAADLGLDNAFVVGLGSSAAATCIAAAVRGPDQRSALGLTDVPAGAMGWAGAVLQQMPTRWQSMDQTILGYMFADSSDSPDFDTPATTLANAATAHQEAYSFLEYDTGNSTPLYVSNASASEGAALTAPYDDDTLSDFHSIDFGAMARLAPRSNIERFVAADDGFTVTGYEDAVLADTDNDDSSPYVLDAGAHIAQWATFEDAKMNPSVFDVVGQYNSVTNAAGASLTESGWTAIIAAGNHKAVTIQNVAWDDTLALLRVVVGDTSGVLGFALPSPSAGVNGPSSITLYTGGNVVYAKSQGGSNLADWQAQIYA